MTRLNMDAPMRSFLDRPRGRKSTILTVIPALLRHGSRRPSAIGREGARFQGRHVGGIALRLARPA